MEITKMVRKALRRAAVIEATGYSVPTLYRKIKDGKFPPGRRLDPEGQAVVWWEDEIEAVQNGTWKPPETEAAA
jgi:predicted DNA-binding transcriptional regulator AlpA